jgi:hypothetical protein
MRRIPVKDIQFNLNTTTANPQPQPKTSHVNVVAIAVISTIAALVLLAAGGLLFICYRRRYNIRRSSASSSGAITVMETVSGVEVTPFVSSRREITRGDPRTGTERDADAYTSSSGLYPQSSTSVPVVCQERSLLECVRRIYALSPPSTPSP